MNDDTSDDDPDPENSSPRSVAETASALELGIELDDHDPLMQDIDGVTMPPADAPEDDEN
ncbi:MULTISPECIES: hypothetical protein [Halobacterium]|uniref:hypothetical protein n=1 Tax=Halobacterium TaxID=2239 RepID=UPI00073E982A|nr:MULTISPECIES: hypothetical protein [Halobacterium]MCG1001883.1 hypothetical protein [Halobacterium noricense]